MAGEKRIRREPAQREELLKIPLNKHAPLKREKCRKTMSRIVFAVWQYASLPKGLNSYDISHIILHSFPHLSDGIRFSPATINLRQPGHTGKNTMT